MICIRFTEGLTITVIYYNIVLLLFLSLNSGHQKSIDAAPMLFYIMDIFDCRFLFPAVAFLVFFA